MGKVNAVLFCDDIRFEASGKLLIVGLYSGDLVVSSFPYTGRLSALVLFTGMPDDPHVKIRVSTATGAIFASAGFDLEAVEHEDDDLMYLPLPPFLVSLSGPETLQIEIAIDDGPFRIAGKLHVVRQEESSDE